MIIWNNIPMFDETIRWISEMESIVAENQPLRQIKSESIMELASSLLSEQVRYIMRGIIMVGAGHVFDH